MRQRFDVAVIGLGPAGRALAHRLAVRGARVVAVDPNPDAVWRPTYGGWLEQLPAWLLPSVVDSTASRVDLAVARRHRLDGTYAMLHNAQLHEALALDGVAVHRALADDLSPARWQARRVVDCRGAVPAGSRHRGPAQTAAGVAVPREAAAGLLAGAEAVLMDWRPYHGGARWGGERASFSYVVPLPGRPGCLLVEETCLAGDPALPLPELRRRGIARLRAAGVPDQAREDGVERVHIPLVPVPRSGDRFGAAGAQLNPISGYSVFASLAQADTVADRLLAGDEVGGAMSPWRLAALSALLRLDGDATAALFDAFGRLDFADQAAVMDPATPGPRLVAALARQWAGMPLARGTGLVGATLRGLPRAAHAIVNQRRRS